MEAGRVEDDPEAQRREWKLGDYGLQDGDVLLVARGRGDHVEPGVAEEHRAREGSEGLEIWRGPQRGDGRGRERECEPEVKTDPGKPIVVGDMPGRQCEREP